MKHIALLALLIFTAFAVNAQTVYTWVPEDIGVLTTPTNWSPNGLLQQVKGCNNIKRLDAVFSGSNTATYGLAATCSSIMPDANTNKTWGTIA